MLHSALGRPRSWRRAAIVVQTAIMATVILGMGALAVDIGTMYAAQSQLQRSVDASALAAAAQLAGDEDGVLSPTQLATQIANQYASLNDVFGVHATLDSNSDIEFGQAVYDAASGQFVFQPGGTNYNAVRVTVRRPSGSAAGPIDLAFSALFGVREKEMQARAAAVLVPRDIAVVIDLSGSMNDDSELNRFKEYYGDLGDLRPGIDVNLRDVWAALNGPAPSKPYVPGAEDDTEYASDNGPPIGVFTSWGNPLTPESYSPSGDPGLWYIPRSQNCTVAAANTSLQARGYNSTERSRLLSGSQDGSYGNQWRNRVAVICGFANWKSGVSGGYSPSGGDNDSRVEDNELVWVNTPSYEKSWDWTNYISYVASTNSKTYQASSQFRYRFGPKTFTTWLLENEYRINDTTLWGTPEMPVQAVKDAVNAMAEVIIGLQSLDQMSLEVFAESVHHEVDLSLDIHSVPARLYQMQAGHYDSTTNIGGGLAQGIAELESPRARPVAKKVIVLMSDGKPNINENGSYVGHNQAVNNYCLAKAEEAGEKGMTIYTVSVGADVDVELMEQIAAIGLGQHFHAQGTPEEYTDQLEAIFRTLGGKRPVALIE